MPSTRITHDENFPPPPSYRWRILSSGSAGANMIDPTRGTGGGERKKSEKRIKYDLWRKDPSMEEGAPVWERSTKPGSWRPLNLTDPGVTLPPLNAYVPPAPVRKSPTPSRPPSASRQSPSDVPIRSSKVASLTISRTDSRSLLIDQEETGKSEKTGKPEDLALLEEVYKPPVMNEALLKSLSHRGKAAYICPRGQECTMGGIDNDGNPTIYRHNSAFR